MAKSKAPKKEAFGTENWETKKSSPLSEGPGLPKKEKKHSLIWLKRGRKKRHPTLGLSEAISGKARKK